MFGLDRRRIRLLFLVGIPSLVLATRAIALLRAILEVPNASIVYLVAVVATAIVAGTPGAVLSAVAAFLLYDFFFVQPLYTFTMTDPAEWLGVALLLFVGIVVGQLAALQRARAEDARAREREAVAAFRVSRELATRDSTLAVLPPIARILAGETSMERVWISLGSDEAAERVAADSEDRDHPPSAAIHQVLRRTPGDAPAEWVRIHQPTVKGRASAAREAGAQAIFRVRMTAGPASFGSIWGLRDRSLGEPDQAETRLLSATADQIAQALAHDRLAAEAQAAEVARQSDALKSALLQSVSHDLRTPLATIRAAAGTLRPGSGLSQEDQLESADAIDREVEYLNRLVTNLLDLSRIEAGALRAERDVFELDDLVEQTLDRIRPRLEGHPVDVDIAAPPVEVDPIFFGEALTNIVENAVKYTEAGTRVRITGRAGPEDGLVRLTVEDAGPGVPQESIGRLFDKFYRVPGKRRTSRAGTGIGLAVVRGLIEATGGRVGARRAELGGLAIDIDLPPATVPAELHAGTA